MDKIKKTAWSRRNFFRAVGATGLTCAAAGSGLTGFTQEARASSTLEDLIAEKMESRANIKMERVVIDTPAKAENGALVRMPISVDHPMEPDNYIASVALFVDNNPRPFVAQFDLTPEAGKASLEIRIRMAKTSKVRAIAKTNGGKLFGAVKEIEVAEGGCAG